MNVTRAADALAYSGVPADNETLFTNKLGVETVSDDWTGTVPVPGTYRSIEVYNPEQSGAGIWTPSRLFSAGEQGVWFDPSDLSTLFQDAAGTVAVTAVGQSVGKMLDKSGRGNHAIQNTSGSRPILRQNANGKYYLEFDGIDDVLTVNRDTFPSAGDAILLVGRNKALFPEVLDGPSFVRV